MKRILSLITLMILAVLQPYGKGRALLIGISDYPVESGWNRINGRNDVEAIAPILEEKGFIVSKLVDQDATCTRIVNEFDTLVHECTRGDIVYIHFSGHGQPYEDFDGDEDDGWDEAIVPYDARKRYVKGVYEGDCHITDDRLGKLIDAIRKKVTNTGKVYVVIDACHAGRSKRGQRNVRGVMDGFSPSGKKYTPAKKNEQKYKCIEKNGSRLAPVKYIEACRSWEANREITIGGSFPAVGSMEEGQLYGPLSYYVAKVLPDTDITRNFNWSSLIEKQWSIPDQQIVIEYSMP